MSASSFALGAGVSSGHSARRWWERPSAAVAAVLLSIVPLLWPTLPPLADLPGHMGSFHLALAQSPALERYFGFHWTLIGNLGVDLLMLPLGHWFGVELGTRIAIAVIPAITVAGMLWLAHEVHGRLPATAAFALPLAYCFPLQFGFVNYCLSAGLMLCGFALWLRLGRQRRPVLRAVAFAAIAIVVWVAHAVGWAMLCLLCGIAELQRRRAARATWPRALTQTFLAWLPLCSPLLLMATLAHHQSNSQVGAFFNVHNLAVWLVSMLRDRWKWFDVASTALLFALVCVAATRRAGLRFAPVLAWSGLALFALFLVAPGTINGSDYVNTRLAPYALAVLLLAIDTRSTSAVLQRRLAWGAAAFLVLRMAGASASFALYDRDWTRNLAALDHIPRGSAVASFTPAPAGARTWYSTRQEHLCAMAIVRRDAFVNCEWDIDGLQLLQVKYAAAGHYSRDPSQMFYRPSPQDPSATTLADRLQGFPRAAFDYLWLVGVPDEQRPRQPDLQPVWSNDDSALYRIQHR